MIEEAAGTALDLYEAQLNASSGDQSHAPTSGVRKRHDELLKQAPEAT